MMLDWSAAFVALLWMFALGAVAWMISLPLKNASIVDSFWALFFVVGALAYYSNLQQSGPRVLWLAAMLSVWALRLAGYITWRNHGQDEDRRYQAIRARNQPHYELKSLLYVFSLQAVLAWIVALSVFGALSGSRPLSWLDALGALLFMTGLLFETIGDWQLARFKASPVNTGKVMTHGLWRYTRHPNYFGEALVWWGFWLIAAAAGHAWTVISPIVMTLLLVKVSGVALLEKDIKERRPDYADYIRRTNAFIPGPSRGQALKGDAP